MSASSALSSSTASPPRIQPQRKPIIPNSWKIITGLAIAAIIALVVVTVLASKGHFSFTMNDWQFKALAGISGIMGGSALFCVPLMLAYYFSQRKGLEERTLRRSLAPSSSPAATTASPYDDFTLTY